MFSPSENKFLELSKQGNLIPVSQEILADLETPVSAYFKIAASAKHSFLLESVEGEEKVARFSFLAKNPELIFETKNKRAKITRFKNGKSNSESMAIKETPIVLIRQIMARYQFVNVPELPRFCGGLVGYLSYDTVRFFEHLPAKTKDDLKLPDILLILAKNLIIFDHRNHKIKIVCCVEIDPQSSDAEKVKKYQKAQKEINRLMEELKRPLAKPKNKNGRKQIKTVELPIKSNLNRDKFVGLVDQAKKEIQKGEIIQVVLSQRFQVDLKINAFEIYRALRVLNPSPYMYYLNFDALQIVGSSPELLVRCEEGIVETRPIAGTRARGKNANEDAALAEDLLNDPKEKAEHIMLVDLGRNDLGRVCQQGSVQVSEFMKIEKYSHVMHIVSNVKGQVSEGQDNFDVLQAAFPAGTVSGAPKIRAMEIIEDLEKVRRGPYAGCIGYFSFSGNLDSCITIRTIIVKNQKAYTQAGAGIVADSDPQKEYLETVNKAKAQIMAIQLAHNHFRE